MPRRKKGNSVHGWINFYKPVGMSSNAAVGLVRRSFNAQKAGHGGTLDPLAEGVLPIALGDATKVLAFMLDGDKTYRFTVAFGAETETDDAEGTITKRSENRPTREALEAILPQFQGAISQLPPVYSALKVNGKRACDRMRDGEVVTLTRRDVTIHSLVLEDFSENQATLCAAVSKGTYIRALARDIGRALGCYGHVTRLIRTKHGFFEEKDTIHQQKLASCLEKGQDAATLLLEVDTPLDDIPAVTVTPAAAARLLSGLTVATESSDRTVARIKNDAGDLVSLATIVDGLIQPKRNFPACVENNDIDKKE